MFERGGTSWMWRNRKLELCNFGFLLVRYTKKESYIMILIYCFLIWLRFWISALQVLLFLWHYFCGTTRKKRNNLHKYPGMKLCQGCLCAFQLIELLNSCSCGTPLGQLVSKFFPFFFPRCSQCYLYYFKKKSEKNAFNFSQKIISSFALTNPCPNY